LRLLWVPAVDRPMSARAFRVVWVAIFAATAIGMVLQ